MGIFPHTEYEFRHEDQPLNSGGSGRDDLQILNLRKKVFGWCGKKKSSSLFTVYHRNRWSPLYYSSGTRFSWIYMYDADGNQLSEELMTKLTTVWQSALSCEASARTTEAFRKEVAKLHQLGE